MHSETFLRKLRDTVKNSDTDELVVDRMLFESVVDQALVLTHATDPQKKEQIAFVQHVVMETLHKALQDSIENFVEMLLEDDENMIDVDELICRLRKHFVFDAGSSHVGGIQ